jgi:hypothetical protein
MLNLQLCAKKRQWPNSNECSDICIDEQVNKRKISFRLVDHLADIVYQSFQNVKHFCYLMNRNVQWHNFGKGRENILCDKVKMCVKLKMTIVFIIIIVKVYDQ